MYWKDDLTCKPLDTYEEIINFLNDPPPWSSLCKDLTPHSKNKLKNIDINGRPDTCLETPETFCHFAPDADEPTREREETLPKILVCHDMANGYHDDSYIDGTGQYDAYTFYNWAAVDIFCYFSHHLITIPPLSWINVGHAHGVKVIGTVITEWSDGVTFWEKILTNGEEYKNFANALVFIAKTLKFDGWLLNVENKMSKPKVLLAFIKYLHHVLHEEIPHAELIWYDSVTIDGHLIWQNGLNDKNRAFFDACDGIFTNYSWSEGDIQSSVAAAGDRIRDLYIGVDVWGRNFYGGGQFNTFAAVKLVHGYKCSLAIFAPAWTHEALSAAPGDANGVALAAGEDRLRRFLLRDRALWGALWPFLSTRLPQQLPFRTSFCRGLGTKRRFYGEVFSGAAWYNLRHQQYQPNAAHGPHGYLLTDAAAFLAAARPCARDQPSAGRDRDLVHKMRLQLHLTEPPDTTDDPPADISDSESEDDLEDQKSELPVPRRTVRNTLRHLFGKVPTTEEAGAEATDLDQDGVALKTAADGGKSVDAVDRGGARRYQLVAVRDERECLQLWLEDAFEGGACLRVHAADRRLTRLLHCDFTCHEALVVVAVTKTVPEYPHQYLNLQLRGGGPNGAVRVLLAGREGAEEGAEEGAVAPLDIASPQFRRVQEHLLVRHSSFYVPVENSFGWAVRYYVVRGEACWRVSSVNVCAGRPQGAVLLGLVGLCPLPLGVLAL